MSRFKHLLAPGRIGTLETRNRIVMSPMGSNLGGEDGHVGERSKLYYEKRARGGVGLIIVGVGAIAHPAGACNPNQVAISDDAFLPGLRDLTARVHRHGAKIAIQLQHAGKVATQDMGAGRPMWVPSVPTLNVGNLLVDLTPGEIRDLTSYLVRPGAKIAFHEMTVADIGALITMFADAAGRAMRAGFDGVEIHAAHGYIIASFLSPAFNRRHDEYGGSSENRARLLVEVIRAIREEVGQNYPVWCRLDAREFRIENGIDVEDARRTAAMAEAAGVDAVHVSAYADPTSGAAFTEAPLVHRPCGYVELACGIKTRLKVPVIAVGRIEPLEAERIIENGKADFIAMGRKLLADPELPMKLDEGRPEDVRPCIYCYTCVGNIFLNKSLSCAVNPTTGREGDLEIVPTTHRRRVLVVGGGPAGMEAARVAALRGHDVILCERSGRLGGTLRLSSLFRAENGALLAYLEAQIRRLPVTVRLSVEITPEKITKFAPDIILVAAGARHTAPVIRGAHRHNVMTGADLRGLMGASEPGALPRKLSPGQRAMLTAARVLGAGARVALARRLTRYWMPFGKRVAIVGGNLVGLELAEFLSERRRRVTILEESETLGVAMALPRRWLTLDVLRDSDVNLLPGTSVEEITDTGVIYRSKNGDRHTLATDSVILAGGLREDRSLADALIALGLDVHLIGDCGGVGFIEGALLDAYRAARAI